VVRGELRAGRGSFASVEWHTSGVSHGQIAPQHVEWSCLGLGLFPSREIGVLSRRRLLLALSAVIRDMTCATPFCALIPFL
jgi:hypothetical protein